MGNKSNFGYIKTDKTTYQAGDNLFGELCLKASTDLYAEKITIEILGYESVEWDEVIDSSMGTHSGKALIIHHKVDHYRFPSNKLAKGDYVFPFIIEIPPDIPSSCSITLPRLRAKIVYIITARVEGSEITATSEVLIRETIHSHPLIAETNARLKGCLWIERGEVYLRAKSVKEAYIADEKLKIIIDMDTSRSSWAVGTLQCSIYQMITAKSDSGKKYIRKETIYSRNLIGFREQAVLEIGLAGIKGNLVEANSTNGKILEVGYCVEIHALMESIFASYGPEPELSVWFSVIPKIATPKVPKYAFKWKPKVIDMTLRNSAPIYS